MDTITLVDLGPVIAAILGPMLVIMAASMRYQHVDSTKTREIIEKSNKDNRELIDKNRELIEKSNQENRELIDKNRELIEKNHGELRDSLGEARERLARIEGYLNVPPPPRHGPEDDADADAEAA